MIATDSLITELPHPGPHWMRRFALIFGGQSLSLLGTAITQFVLLWWITDTTKSVTALSMAGLAALLPQALLGPVGGPLADRYSRRLIMMVADSITALCVVILILLVATGRLQLWHVYTMMALRSAMQAFQAPAAVASTAMLVPQDFLPRAAGLSQTVQGAVTIVSAPLGALAIARLPLTAALAIDVVTALLGIVPLLIYAIPQFRMAATQQHFWADFREGVAVVWQNRGLRTLYALIALVVMLIMPTMTLILLLIREQFGGGADQAALLQGLSGVGLLGGGVLVTVLAPRQRVAAFLSGFGLSCLMMALTALTPARWFGLAALWWALGAAAFTFGFAPIYALLQAVVPNQLQGRVFSLMGTISALAAPIGLLLAGPLGHLIGVRGLFIGGGLLGALVCVAGFFSPALRHLERPVEAPVSEL